MKKVIEPQQFKEGDIVSVKTAMCHHIFIFKEIEGGIIRKHAVNLCNDYSLYMDDRGVCCTDEVIEMRHTTEEEKQKLFDAVKKFGYRWNTETKTLEKLIAKFKVGDKIVKRNSVRFPRRNSWIVVSINSKFYEIKLSESIGSMGVIPISEQDDWELVPNKFDITTLVPFESMVLVRDTNNVKWWGAFYSHYDATDSHPFHCISFGRFKQCIPFKGNEHLLGKADDCDEYFKTWK